MLTQRGNIQEANRELRAYADSAPADVAKISVADQCLLLKDYDLPELDSRNDREPTVDGPRTFVGAIRLSKSLRELGDTGAADHC